MAKVIDFYLRGPVPKKVKPVPIEQRGKLVEFPKENIAAQSKTKDNTERGNHIFFLRHRRRCVGGVESCQGRRFLAFILTLDRSRGHFIIERGTKRNAVQLSFVLS